MGRSDHMGGAAMLWWLMSSTLVLGCAVNVEDTSGEDAERATSRAQSAIVPAGLVVNECQSGAAGWVELFNAGSSAIDLAADAAWCWHVDDVALGAKPKLITDSNVNHQTGSTTCAAAGRGASCNLVGPGERVWLSYGYVNASSADQCRLVKSARSGSVCSKTYVDELVGGATASTSSGQCFGRSSDGGTWSSSARACTPNGGSNGPSCPNVGQPCDDGDACTVGEIVDASCECSGGASPCEDGQECTTDTCDLMDGCSNTPVVDGTACTGGTCQAGACVPAPPPQTPVVVINEFSAGSSGWVELYNTGTVTADVSGYQIDDVANAGSAPKTLASGSTIAPGSFLVVTYGGINTASADQVRLVDQLGNGVAGPGDATSSFWSGTSIAGLCFGRSPNGDAWASSAITCSQGSSNPGASCTVGAGCDDGNACTTGEIYASDCSCGGGTNVTCNDADPCTWDTCSGSQGCTYTPVGEGSSCGTGLICQAGQCVTGTWSEPVIVGLGAPGAAILRGTIVTPDVIMNGEVLVESDTITCVAPSCAGMSQTGTPSIVETNGIILPGLIDTHNHILFDIFDESDWSPTQAYANHNQWPNDARYGAMVDAKQYLNGEYGSTVNVGCEMNKYGELKGLIAGTTSIVGAANPSNKICYGSLARTIDQTPNDLPADKVQAATLFPSTATADGVCSNIQGDQTDSFLVHVGEGVDQTSLNEFASLYSVPTTDGCLHVPETTIVHGTAFGATEFASMASAGMSLVWSPRSNVFLYGLGTDFTKTTNIPLALSYGINVALAPDWSIGGSQNLLDELRFANTVDDAIWANTLSPYMLTRMVTIQAAQALGLDQLIGSIAVGKKADLLVIGGDANAPYDALLASRPRDVRLVMVNGVALYGAPLLQAIAPATPGCETLDVCGDSKFVCVAETGGTASNKLGQTLAELQSTLGSELASYDAQNLSAWDFAPIAPLVKCQ